MTSPNPSRSLRQIADGRSDVLALLLEPVCPARPLPGTARHRRVAFGACQVEGTASGAGSGGPDGGAATTPRPVTPTSSAPDAGMRRRLSVKVSNASVVVLALEGGNGNGHQWGSRCA